jgi:threonine synthase
MDVGNPSNLARLQFLYHNDMALMRRDISAVSISEDETLAEIRRTYERNGTILDPHTAVGVAAARKAGSQVPSIVAATAHPSKFPEVIKRALGINIGLHPMLESALQLPKKSIRIKSGYQELKDLLIID